MKPDRLYREASRLETLDQVFRWAISKDPRFLPRDVVIQDEYTHDVIFAAREDLFVVFDAT